MNVRVKAAAFLLAPIAAAALVSPACGQQGGRHDDREGCRPVWISGQVNSVDWVGRKFSMQPYGAGPGYMGLWGEGAYRSMPQELRFLVTGDTSFIQQTRAIGFTELAQSDYVSVLFCRGNSIDPIAIRVVINNSYPKN